MSVDVTHGDLTPERWDRLVARSPAGTPFHRHASVETFAEHADMRLHPLVGFVGQEPVGVFPIFEKSKGPFAAVFSPPPALKINYLGPAPCNLQKLKTRKRELRHRRFIEGCLDYVEDRIGPMYRHVRTSYGYTDPRPFEWREFEVTARYTYVVDLDRSERALLQAFSSDARQNVRAVSDSDCEVYEGGHAEIDRIIEQVAARHREQDKSYKLTPAVVHDLYDRLPDGVVRPYAATVDGEFAGGIVTLESDDAIYRWQGGVTPDVELPVNDALDWHVMTDAISRGVTTYDFLGANNHRLCGYKAKFAPDLRTYHSLERGSRSMNVASSFYSRLRK